MPSLPWKLPRRSLSRLTVRRAFPGDGVVREALHDLRVAAHTFEFPVTVSLIYADGSADDVVVTVDQAQVTKTLPLKKRLRSVEVNRDRITPVRVVKN